MLSTTLIPPTVRLNTKRSSLPAVTHHMACQPKSLFPRLTNYLTAYLFSGFQLSISTAISAQKGYVFVFRRLCAILCSFILFFFRGTFVCLLHISCWIFDWIWAVRCMRCTWESSSSWLFSIQLYCCKPVYHFEMYHHITHRISCLLTKCCCFLKGCVIILIEVNQCSFQIQAQQ